MDDLGIEELKQLVTFYRQRASELEFSNLQLQLKFNRIINQVSQPIPATKVSAEKKTKSE